MLRSSFGSAGTVLTAAALSFGFALAGHSTHAVAQSSDSEATPDFSGYWQRARPLPSTFLRPEDETLPGPVWDPQDHEDGGVLWLGDTSNPILRPAAAAKIDERNNFLLSGGEDLPAYSLCWPTGVPQVLNLREPVQFLQTDYQVTILFQRDHQVRRVFLNAAHSQNPRRSWYGESVGHYEGSALVVDTIAQNDRTDVDKFGTPHSDQIHVVERFMLEPDGESMTVEFMVEDPENFTTAWFGRATYSRARGPIEEIICAENNKNASTGEDYPIPINHGPSDF
jgi:hypothetical protein